MVLRNGGERKPCKLRCVLQCLDYVGVLVFSVNGGRDEG